MNELPFVLLDKIPYSLQSEVQYFRPPSASFLMVINNVIVLNACLELYLELSSAEADNKITAFCELLPQLLIFLHFETLAV